MAWQDLGAPTCVGPNFATAWALSPGGQQRWGKKPPKSPGPSRPRPAALRRLPNALSRCTQAGGVQLRQPLQQPWLGFVSSFPRLSPWGKAAHQELQDSASKERCVPGRDRCGRGAADTTLLLLLRGWAARTDCGPQHSHQPRDSHRDSHSTPASTQRTATSQHSPPTSTQRTATSQRSPPASTFPALSPRQPAPLPGMQRALCSAPGEQHAGRF